MTTSNQNHLDINRFAHALSILLSEQTGMDVTVTYRLNGGEHIGRIKCTDHEKTLGSSGQAS